MMRRVTSMEICLRTTKARLLFVSIASRRRETRGERLSDGNRERGPHGSV